MLPPVPVVTQTFPSSQEDIYPAGIDRAVPAVNRGMAGNVCGLCTWPPGRSFQHEGLPGAEAFLELGPSVLEVADQYERLAEAVRRL